MARVDDLLNQVDDDDGKSRRKAIRAEGERLLAEVPKIKEMMKRADSMAIFQLPADLLERLKALGAPLPLFESTSDYEPDNSVYLAWIDQLTAWLTTLVQENQHLEIRLNESVAEQMRLRKQLEDSNSRIKIYQKRLGEQ